MDMTSAQGQDTTRKLSARYVQVSQSPVTAPGITSSNIADSTTAGVEYLANLGMPSEVKIGETIIINPGEKTPLDGVCIKGATALDTKALTGEAKAEPTSCPRGKVYAFVYRKQHDKRAERHAYAYLSEPRATYAADKCWTKTSLWQ